MIDILVPVLGRPQNAQPLVDSIRANTTSDHKIWFICSTGDEEQRSAASATEADYVIIAQWPSGPGDYSRKINHAYRGLRIVRDPEDFVFTAADDVEFTPEWDLRILEVAQQTGAGMVGSNDDANPVVKRGKHSTHTLFSRDYVDTVGATFFDGPGVVFHEGYKHQWVDTEAVKAAIDRRQWAYARRSVVRHHHPFYDKSVAMDDTYRKALGGAHEDATLYRTRLKQAAAIVTR